MLEMVRRISEREAEEKRVMNKASRKAINELPVVTIEEKHCKVKNGVV
jgi:hypothetical protein